MAVGRFLRTVPHHRRMAAVAFRLRRPDGVARHMRVVAEPVFGPDGRLMAARGAYQDISSQHWTEVALSVTRDQLAHTEQQSAARNRLALQLRCARCTTHRPGRRHAGSPPGRPATHSTSDTDDDTCLIGVQLR
ncbi:hypothetical protein AB0K12_38000 [Nonomuraea sp. NPDC049419]|uniref:hypothetical protein n=1 Tax=Nonomuraea sp. NPDC049419 TaxID=3155772 RepID=UPI00342A22D1